MWLCACSAIYQDYGRSSTDHHHSIQKSFGLWIGHGHWVSIGLHGIEFQIMSLWVKPFFLISVVNRQPLILKLWPLVLNSVRENMSNPLTILWVSRTDLIVLDFSKNRPIPSISPDAAKLPTLEHSKQDNNF